ncbi:MAG: DUF1573 domain-containing protein [Saprospiraceae bacterium]
MDKNMCKMLWLRFTILAAFTLWYTGLQAQPIRGTTPALLLEAADEKMAEHDYVNAVQWYEEAYKELRTEDLAVQIASIYGQLRNYKLAESWYGRIAKRDRDNKYPESHYYYGLYLRKNGKYQEAFQEFKFFLDSFPQNNLRPLVQKEVAGILAQDDLPKNEDMLVINVGRPVNSMYTDASPTMDAEGNLYLTSFQRNKLIVKDGKETDLYAKIYETSKDDKGKWDKPKALPDDINVEGIHNGNVFISPDGGTMYFIRMAYDGDSLTESKLFVSTKRGRGWTPPKYVQGINGDYLVKHPMEGELYGENVMFFTANIPGGKGGFDLYYAPRQAEDAFGTPVNLGDVINTAGDDVSPYYRDGKLYFSTDGRTGMGGFDIFKTEWNGSAWSAPQNLGYRFNSTADDLSFYVDGSGVNGFLVSNRASPTARSVMNKTCCDDIYFFTEKTIKINLLAGIFDEQGKALTGATVNVYEMLEDERADSPSGTLKQDDNNIFDFPLEGEKAYTATVEREGYFPDTIQFNTVGLVDDYTIKRAVRLKMKPAKPETETITVTEPIRLNNIYYNFDDDKILPDAEKDLAVLLDLLNRYPDMVIELGSHTDSQGNDAYNDDLSRRRAESAKQWLVDRGIDPKRINAVGYGERFILNRCTNGVPCTDDEHRFNRRTEFKILEGPTTIEIQKEILTQPNNRQKGGPDGAELEIRLLMPEMKIEDSFHDFGLLKQGEVKDHIFTFTNSGDADLVIRIATGGKDLKVKWPKDPVPPGKNGEVKVTFDSTDKQGEYEVTIQMVANTIPNVVEARVRAFVKGSE